MRLKVLTPTEVVIDEEVRSVVAEGADGSFCLRPRHVDFVSSLVPGLLSYVTASGGERYAALDRGTLVKKGGEVLLSVRDALHGVGLEDLVAAVHTRFADAEERERGVRTAMARLEADFLRRFMELK